MAALTPIDEAELKAAENLLWAIVSQAVMDATGDADDPGRDANGAAQFIVRTFGMNHPITRATALAVAEGRAIHVQIH